MKSLRELKFAGKKRLAAAAVGTMALAVVTPIGIASANAAETSTQARVVGTKSESCNVNSDIARGSVTIKVSRYDDGRRLVRLNWTGVSHFELKNVGLKKPMKLKSTPSSMLVNERLEAKKSSKTSYRYWVKGAGSYQVHGTWRIDDLASDGKHHWEMDCTTKTFKY